MTRHDVIQSINGAIVVADTAGLVVVEIILPPNMYSILGQTEYEGATVTEGQFFQAHTVIRED